MSSTSSRSRSLSLLQLFLLFLLLQLFLPPGLPHPQPCLLLQRIGHKVRVGALLPAQRGVRVRVQAALNRAVEERDNRENRDPEREKDRDPEMRTNFFLPYNLSVELVSRQPVAADPDSVLRCGCADLGASGVSAVLAFPQNREELLQLDLMSSFMEIPFISVLEQGEPSLSEGEPTSVQRLRDSETQLFDVY
ncbi:Glutamate receptor ionotropic NMDA 3A [Dissostichus eleginoides]|uniref:Glutamate receptor ionotropic NMDA 3A n=1 Tax=Dissostichus eleginoides TaxID=100907 RepID=A0AAD9CA03_DISEL|nr:Glutamate receptor ionotropic NMDA 3A [Dissostichus eleginoides]